MQRYFVNPRQWDGDQILVEGDDVHHMTRVMRMRPGDRVVCCDGEGTDLLAVLEDVKGDRVLLRVLERTPSRGEPAVAVTVAQALPKGDKWEWVLQKGTELGAASFLPVLSDRSVVKLDGKKADKKRERWQKIIKEAAEQSHRGCVPPVQPVVDWDGLMQAFSVCDRVIFAYEKGGVPLNQALADGPFQSLMIVVGPEGGFTSEEAEQARTAGALPVSLGPRILRSETAPLALLSCILYSHGEMGGEPL
ncbi:16S rRNA (uracil(1498)-N(3))-methyltransferase [Desmospora profundinema]|uniref:Ribosomal RNA small subunit methyltransferase E n=1 Tax=Desmospora profundinema TaxID=1571184 RepID=A0ABU1IJV5_9BACL|nr:16S rRNA (uracil(1498)-N(3))-methyltransferase [Desmospora profundinema]MDR6225061.1 16S rRNA (uracil1498-N3)-methyltransferase [Desmospora profundinema]